MSEYGIYDSAGLELIATAAECLDRMRQAQAVIDEHGVVIICDDGSLKSNPANKVSVDNRNGMLSVLRILNLDMEPAKAHGRPSGP